MYQNRFTKVGGRYRVRFTELTYGHRSYTLPMEKTTTQQTTPSYPTTASIFALIGGVLMLLGGVLFIAVSAFILPHLDFTQFHINSTQGLASSSIPAIASGVLGVMGTFGLVSGVIVLISAVMLLSNVGNRRTWGVLILVFSILSFLGFGGFIIGAILGMVGGILTLRWKPSAP